MGFKLNNFFCFLNFIQSLHSMFFSFGKQDFLIICSGIKWKYSALWNNLIAYSIFSFLKSHFLVQKINHCMRKCIYGHDIYNIYKFCHIWPENMIYLGKIPRARSFIFNSNLLRYNNEFIWKNKFSIKKSSKYLIYIKHTSKHDLLSANRIFHSLNL